MKTYISKLNQISLKLTKSNFNKIQIKDSQTSADYIRQFYFDDIEIFESFFIVLLNRSNNTIGYAKISQGGCTGTVVDTKIIAKYCIDSFAQSVILCHNHPSGNLTPSLEDKAILEKVKQALLFFDCTVLDNIILTADGYFSFADEGLL